MTHGLQLSGCHGVHDSPGGPHYLDLPPDRSGTSVKTAKMLKVLNWALFSRPFFSPSPPLFPLPTVLFLPQTPPVSGAVRSPVLACFPWCKVALAWCERLLAPLAQGHQITFSSLSRHLLGILAVLTLLGGRFSGSWFDPPPLQLGCTPKGSYGNTAF